MRSRSSNGPEAAINSIEACLVRQLRPSLNLMRLIAIQRADDPLDPRNATVQYRLDGAPDVKWQVDPVATPGHPAPGTLAELSSTVQITGASKFRGISRW